MKCLAASLFALLLLGGAARAQSENPIARGHALAREFCARCHAIGERGRSPHKHAPPLRYLGRTYDLDDFARVLSRGLASGHPDMPQFRFHYPDARYLRDYLRTIQE